MATMTLQEPLAHRILFDENTINQRLDALAAEINAAHANDGQPLLVICVLKGAFIFAADLIRRLTIPCQIEFVRFQSYHGERQSSGQVTAIVPLGQANLSLDGRHVLVVEDIADTGLTLNHFLDEVKAKYHPKSVEVAVLLDKAEARQHPVQLDYIAFSIPKQFVIGYGLDDKGLYRNLPYIGVVGD
jgi:hypoxanthine phosphoribosyltransferase